MLDLLKRLKEYWTDKALSDKCGLKVSDICAHEFSEGCDRRKCKKCGTVRV